MELFPPKISIIVPVYKVQEYVEECIDSVMKQTYKGPLECIIVDDCGSDNSISIVKKKIDNYSGPINFYIYHHNHNSGLSAARNTGMDLATGQYYFFLDSDDFLEPKCLELLSSPLTEDAFDYVVGYNSVMNQPKEQIRRITLSGGRHQSPESLDAFLHGQLVVAWNKLYNADFIKRHHLRFKEGVVFEDNLWSLQVNINTTSIYVVDTPTYVYRYRPDSIMTHPMSNWDRCNNRAEIVYAQSKYIEGYPSHIRHDEMRQYVKSARCGLFNAVSKMDSDNQRLFFNAHYRHLRDRSAWYADGFHPSLLFNVFRSPILAWQMFYLTRKLNNPKNI